MANFKESVHLTISPHEAWRRFGGFGDVGDWHPMLQSVESEGHYAGAKRVARTKDGGTQVERLTAYDAAHRRYSYVMEESALPVENYTAEFAVEAADHGSNVRWSASFDVSEDGSSETVDAVQAFLRGGLDALP